MWPFKKKIPKEDTDTVNFETVICIPGNWINRDDFLLKLVVETNGEYLAAGNILMNVKEKQHVTFEFCEHDPAMKDAFGCAGMVNGVRDFFLDEIEKHKHVVYLSGATGSMDKSVGISFAASALLKSGGIGVKIETAGKAFEKEQWLSLTDNFQESNVYEMFVVDSIFNSEDTSTYSCGMQNIGLKDTIVTGEDFQYAAGLIRIFGCYQVVDKPEIHENQTFSLDEDSPRFRITNEPNQPNLGDKLFENPFGMWRLTRIE